MSWKSFLGPLAAIGGVAAAPFTAGTSLSWVPAALSAGGAALGAASSADAANRGTEAEIALEQEKLRLAREGQQHDQRGDAWKRLQYADYVLSGGADQRPRTFRSEALGTTRELPTYGFSPRPTSEAEQAGAQAYRADAERLLNARPAGSGHSKSYADLSPADRRVVAAALKRLGVGDDRV